MRTPDYTRGTLRPATDWDSYYLQKPTDLKLMYPLTKEMQLALEDQRMDRVIRRISRIITTLIVLVSAALAYATYPSWSWLTQY